MKMSPAASSYRRARKSASTTPSGSVINVMVTDCDREPEALIRIADAVNEISARYLKPPNVTEFTASVKRKTTPSLRVIRKSLHRLVDSSDSCVVSCADAVRITGRPHEFL